MAGPVTGDHASGKTSAGVVGNAKSNACQHDPSELQSIQGPVH